MTMPISKVWFTLAIGLVAGCGSDGPSQPPFDQPVTVSASDVWAGGTVQLQSDDFSAGGDDLTVTIGGVVAAATRVDDNTFRVAIPGDLSGLRSLVVTWRGVERTLAPLTLYGFDVFSLATVFLPQDQLVIPGAQPLVIGGDLNDDLVFINLVTGAEQIFPGMQTTGAMHGPGITYDPDVFILAPGSGSGLPERWRLFPTLQRIDSLPSPGLSWQIAQISANVLFRGGNSTQSIYTRADASAPFMWDRSESGSEAEGVFLSPRGDRAAIVMDFAGNPPIPVLDAATGATAWRATGFAGLLGAAFSADGERLVLVGPDSAHGGGSLGSAAQGSRIAVHDATSGALIAARTIDLHLLGTLLDPSADLLYVVANDIRSTGVFPQVLVLRASTLDLVAAMRVPGNAPACANGCYKAVAAVSAEPALYVVAGTETPLRAVRYRFTLPPGR